MELLSPAGSAEKLVYAYRYGADAAYIGLPNFSLRTRAENIDDADDQAPERLRAIKAAFPGAPKKLYGALNIYFHDKDLEALRRALPRIAEYPFDGFIVSDLGAYDLLREAFPDREFHLSTQANCTSWRAAKVYRDMGFSRVVPARELSLGEIAEIKDRVPGLEVEVFVHGAMCMAYSGRCFISSWLTGRSANEGDCTHSCRWNYRVYLEEEKRPGQFFPVEGGETAQGPYSLVMSSRDTCMIDHLAELEAAGVDAVKIEGRMKSLYYAALATRAYRWGIDRPGEPNPFREDLFAISHREYDTGFYFGRLGMDVSAVATYGQAHLFAGSLEQAPPAIVDSLGAPADLPALFARFREDGWSEPAYAELKNTIPEGAVLEAIAPDSGPLRLEPGDYRFFDADGAVGPQARHGKAWFLQARLEALGGRVPGAFWLLRLAV
jgi:putative protease